MTLQELRLLSTESCHLAVFTEPYLSLLLQGKKTVESRWMRNKIAPYGKVHSGDLVYVKKSGGPVMASFRVGWRLEGALPLALAYAVQHQAALCVADAFLLKLEADKKNFGVLMEVTRLHVLNPVPVVKPGMNGWVVLP